MAPRQMPYRFATFGEDIVLRGGENIPSTHEVSLIAKSLQVDRKYMVPVSSLSGFGKDNLWKALRALVENQEEASSSQAVPEEISKGEGANGSSAVGE